MEINGDHPWEKTQRLFSQSLLQQGSLPPSLALASGVGKLYSERKGRLQVVDMMKLETG